MDFGKTLTNPLVLAGGAVIGLIVLMNKSDSGAAVVSSGYSQAGLAATVQMNSAALSAQTSIAGIDADVAKAGFATDTAQQANILSFLKSMDDNATTTAVNRNNINAGITQSIISSSTMLAVDVNNNATRLGLGAQETDRSRIAADATVEVARYQYKSAKAAGGGVLGKIASLAGTAIGAATGMSSVGAAFGGATSILSSNSSAFGLGSPSMTMV